MPKAYQVKDKYFLLAKERGYRARSAFKLLDIQRKFRILKKGQTVVDLGAAPGSFIQVVWENVGPKGRVLGIDLQEIDSFDEANIRTIQADIYNKEELLSAFDELGFGRVDVVTSDLAPKTSGIRDVDQARSAELTDHAFYLASQILRSGGSFVGKIFEGEDMQWLLKRIKKKFKTVKVFKAPSSRDRSFERFIVALGYKAD